MNKIILMGRLTRDPEVRYGGASNTAVARFSLAVDRRFKREGAPETDFFNCVAFGRQGEFLASDEIGGVETRESMVAIAGEVHDVLAESFGGRDGVADGFVLNGLYQGGFAFAEGRSAFLPVEGEAIFGRELFRGRDNDGRFRRFFGGEDEIVDRHFAGGRVSA